MDTFPIGYESINPQGDNQDTRAHLNPPQQVVVFNDSSFTLNLNHHKDNQEHQPCE